MSDAIQAALHEWRCNPGDRDALESAVAAHRRAGLSVPGYLTDARTDPARSFSAPWRFAACAVLPRLEVHERRWDSLSTWRPLLKVENVRSFEVPESLFWWVRPKVVGKKLPEVLAHLQAEQVPGLSLAGSRSSDQVIAGLGNYENLVALDLRGCPSITRAGLEVLPPTIRYLDTGGCSRLRNYSGLSKCPELTHLRTSRYMDAAQLPILCNAAPQLTNLTCSAKNSTASQLAAIGDLSELVDLDLTGTGFSRSAISMLAKLPYLRRLSLAHCNRLTDAAFEDLVLKCPRLTHLDLRGNALGERTLLALLEHPGLTYLTLWASWQQDWSVLSSLASHPVLRTLDIRDCEKPPAHFLKAFPAEIRVLARRDEDGS